MKAILPAAFFALGAGLSIACIGAEQAAKPVDGPTVAPPVTASSTPVPAEAPAVTAIPPTARMPPLELTPEVSSLGEVSTDTNPIASSGLSSELAWSGNGVELRQPTAVVPRTNRVFELRGGVVPKLMKPERRGFGGFLVGFANLFNPLAPVEKGIAVGSQHWYDSQINSAPLPRGLRDERYHEPQTELLVLGLDGDLKKPDVAEP